MGFGDPSELGHDHETFNLDPGGFNPNLSFMEPKKDGKDLKQPGTHQPWMPVFPTHRSVCAESST